MSDDPRAIDNGWDALPGYAEKLGDADDAVTVSISTTPGEWLVNTVDAVVVPMSMMEVVEALRSQRLNERSLVWRAGMQEWSQVDRVPQLKLAARLPSSKPSAPPVPPAKIVPTPTLVPPAATATPRPTNTTKPPPKPARPASTPAPPAVAAPLPSRKATLPFGVTSAAATPNKFPAIATPSRPFQARPAPRTALPPPASAEDSEVLAVYARPAATISFDLSPEPVRTISAPAPPVPPQTLAPTTTDSAPQRLRVSTLPPPRSADLSVVAASQFRQAQRFSKRLIFASSIGSAAVASLLTMWLSQRDAEHRAAVAPPAPAQTLVAPTEPTPPPVVVAPPAVSAPELVAEQEPEPSTKAKAKPKRAKAWQRPARPSATTADSTPASSDPAPSEPKSEANPYDVQLDEDSGAKAKPPSPSHGSGLDSEETATTAPTSPGF